MVFYQTSILLDVEAANTDGGKLSGVNSMGNSPLVFRSLCVDRKSKTPYSDATQVRARFFDQIFKGTFKFWIVLEQGGDGTCCTL